MPSPDSGSSPDTGLSKDVASESSSSRPVAPRRVESSKPTGKLPFLRLLFPRWSIWRALGGCLLAFICVVLFYAAIGGVAVYDGLRERAALTKQEAVAHYDRGVVHVQNEEYELAIAEFEHALRLDPTHREARDAMRDAKTTALAQPTPTSATLNQALVSILAEAEGLMADQKWAEAVARLTQLRDLDAGYEADRVSALLYEAEMNLGREQVAAGDVDDGVLGFQQALSERPGDAEASEELKLASLYASAQAAWGVQWPDAINYLEELYSLAPDYLDVATLIYRAYDTYGDDLSAEGAWCLAERQYNAAALLQPGDEIKAKRVEAEELCEQAAANPTEETPEVKVIPTATPVVTATVVVSETTASVGGRILFSRFDSELPEWQVVAVPAEGGDVEVMIPNALQPAVSPNGKLVAYVPAGGEDDGIHVFDLATGEDRSVTTFKEDVLPHWAPDNTRLVFPSVRSGDRRWRIYIGWDTDEEGDAVPLLEGRTPAWSPDGGQIAFQGTDEEGNNPGIYLVSADGGPVERVTNGESDRYPAWSPNCRSGACQLAFMSSRSGNWQIYVVDAEGGTPRQLTTMEGNNGLPVWSPDGKYLAFVSDRDGTWGIYAVPASGGLATRVADWGQDHADWLLERLSWTR
jgi:tetratricopeptide (TPR) repeat protein